MVSWKDNPACKVEAGATNISSDSLDVTVFRPENMISRCHLVANDLEGVNYIGQLDAFTVLKVSFRYGADSYTKVFEGVVEKVGPILTDSGQHASAVAYGYGRALRNTHCAVSYGVQSENPTIDEPTEIWDDLVDNRINKGFDGDVTGYALTKTKIKTVASPNIHFLPGYYQNNLALINEVCQIYTADQAGAASVHWFVDPTKNLWIDTIGAHTVDAANWPTWWRTDQAGSTLVEGKDFVGYNFHKQIQGFANKIIVCSDLRKPGYDYWTEDSGGAALWGNDALTSITDDNTAGPPAHFIVGSHSVNFDPDGANAGYGYYPAGASANWNLALMGSEKTVPSVNFYAWNHNLTVLTTYIYMSTNDTARKTDYYYATFFNFGLFGAPTEPADEWIHKSIPVGPYWATKQESHNFRWGTVGNPDWTNIDSLEFSIQGGGANAYLMVDDLHFSGKVIREAENTTSIAAYDEHQKVIRMDVAVDDSLVASDDSGTAAQIGYAELLTCQTIPVVGTVTTPGIVDVLPGQLIHVHADEYDIGLFRVNDDFRIKEITHSFSRNGFVTTLDVTDDVTNTFALGSDSSHSKYLSTLSKVMHVDPEAKNLKASGIDPLIQRLTKDYP